MASGSSAPQTPAPFHGFISLAVGGWVPVCAHRQQMAALVLLLGLWVGFQIFMHVRARQARGVFIDEEVELFSWFGAAGFLGGLSIVSSYFVIYG